MLKLSCRNCQSSHQENNEHGTNKTITPLEQNVFYIIYIEKDFYLKFRRKTLYHLLKLDRHWRVL